MPVSRGVDLACQINSLQVRGDLWLTGFVSSGKWFHHFFGTLRHAPHQSGGDGIVTKQDLGGRLALLLAAMIWGSAFFVMKNAVDSICLLYTSDAADD